MGFSSHGSPPGPVFSQGVWKAQRARTKTSGTFTRDAAAPHPGQARRCPAWGLRDRRGRSALSSGSGAERRGGRGRLGLKLQSPLWLVGLQVLWGALEEPGSTVGGGQRMPLGGAPAGASTWGGRAIGHQGPPSRGDL